MKGARAAARLGRVVSGLAAWLALAGSALAASPSPAAGGGDPRSSGQGPGLVGDPAFALLVVAAIAVGATLLTIAWIRLTAKRVA
jgi:hypothetical protein